MNLKQMSSIWRRRWVLTTALVLLALLGTAAATQVLPKQYQAQSMVTLLPSTNFSKTNGNNPYLSFDGSLPVTAQLISFQLMDPRMVQMLSNEGYSATFTNAPAVNSTGPVLQTVVVGGNKALVEHTLTGVTNQIGTELASLQSGIPNPNNKITVETLSFDPKPTLQVSKTARPIVVVLFFGLVLALAIPLAVDGQMSRSQKLAKSRKPAKRAVRTTTPSVPGPRTPAPPVPPAQTAPAATPATAVAAVPEWASKPAEPDWASKPAEQEWASEPAGQEWLPTTPTTRPAPSAKPDWPAAPVPQPARTEWPAAPVPPPSRPEWVGKPSAPQAEPNGADTQNGADAQNAAGTQNGAGTPAQTEWPAKPGASLFGSDPEEPAQPASSRFHKDDEEPAKPMPWDEDRAKDASPAGGGGKDSGGQNGSGKDRHDRETVTVPAGQTSADDLDDGPATQPQERVT